MLTPDEWQELEHDREDDLRMEKRITKGSIKGLLIATSAAYSAVEHIDDSVVRMWSHVDDGEARLDYMEADALTQRLERLSHELYRVHRELQIISMEVWP